jgi:hypothetical protein
MDILFNSPKAAIAYLKRQGLIVSVVDKTIASSDGQLRTWSDPVYRAWQHLRQDGYTINTQLGYGLGAYGDFIEAFGQINRGHRRVVLDSVSSINEDLTGWHPPVMDPIEWHSTSDGTNA